MQALVEALRQRTSVLNPDDGKKYYTVTNPMVDGIEEPGVWRGVNVVGIENPAVGPAGTIQQTLAYGFATTLIDTEARLVGGDNIPLQPERILQRQYVALDFTKIGTMVDGIETTKYIENPVIEGKTYGTVLVPIKWRILSSKPSRDRDGSGIITQTLAKNLVQTPDALPTAILLSDEKALLSPFAHDVTSVKNSYIWEYRWIDPDYAQTLRDTISLTVGVIDAKVIKVDDGTCNIQVLTQTNTWEGDLSQVWEKRTESPTFAAEKIVNTYSHIPLTDLDTFKTTLGTATSGYKVSSLVDSTDATGGFAQIVQTQDKLFSGTVTASNGTNMSKEYLLLLTDGIILTTAWLGVKDADVTTAMTTLATAPTGYTVLRVGHNYNGTGSFTLTREMITKATVLTATQLRVQFPTFDDERRTYYYFGLDKTTAETQYTTCKTTCDIGYKVDSVEIIEWRGGALAVVQQISKINTALTGKIRAYDYTRTFGLVNIATTLYLNVAVADIAALKVTILADATKIILDLSDDDVGQGKANVTVIWRSKETAPRSLGVIRSTKSSQFHKEEQDRLWIDINLEDKDSLATAVALAMAGTAPYNVIVGAEIREVVGEDAGDKTARIRQHIVKEGTPDPADYSMQESFNPHGLREATMLISVKEYPEIAYVNLAAIFATLRTFLGDPMKGRIQVSMNGNGTFMMRGLKEGTPDWDNTTPTYVQVGIHKGGLIGEGKTELATGIPVESAAAIVATATADADHVLEDVTMDERGMGEAAITKRQTKKSETAIIVRAFPAIGTQRAAIENTWPLVLNANIDVIWTAALTEGVTGNYVLKYRTKENLSNGMWRVSNWVEAATEVMVAAFTSEDRADMTDVVEHKQDATAIPNAEDSAGVNVSVSGTLNAVNKYDYEKVTRTATSQEISGSFPDRNGTTYWWSGTYCTQAQYAAAIAAAALDTTTDNSVAKQSTQFSGLFNYYIIKRPINTLWVPPSALSYGPYTEIGLDWNSNRSQYRKKTVTYTIYYNTTDANNHADYSGSGPGGWEGRDGNQWKCKKVTNITTGSWIDAGSIDF